MSTFWSRHKNKLAWLGGIIGSGYILYKYGQIKWQEFQERQEIEQAARAK